MEKPSTPQAFTGITNNDDADCARLMRQCQQRARSLANLVGRCRQETDPQRKAECWELANDLQESVNACWEDYAFYCGNPYPPTTPARANIAIAGAEITQSIQYFGVGGTGFDQDNALPLCEGKETLVRVYLENRLEGARVIDGALVLERAGSRLEIAPIAPCVVDGGSTSNRTPVDATLNFRIPASEATAGPKLSAFAWFEGEERKAGSTAVPYSRELWFAPRVQPTLVVYRIEYVSFVKPAMGAAVDTLHAAPSFADCQATFEEARRMFPLTGFSLVDAGSFSYAKKVDATNERTNQADWLGIYNLVKDLRQAAYPTPGDHTVYVGMMESVGRSGWGFGDAATLAITSFAGDGAHFAHEFGHVAGCCHVEDSTCSVHPSDTCAFPDYPNTGTQSGIGETGARIDTEITLRGADTPDIMSYCANRWISPHHWKIAFWSNVLQPKQSAGRYSRAAEPEPSGERKLVFTVRLHRGGRVELVKAWWQKGQALPTPGGTPVPGGFAEIYDSSGLCRVRSPLYVRAPAGASSTKYRECTEAMPWPHDGRALVILNGDEELARFEQLAEDVSERRTWTLRRNDDGSISPPELPAGWTGVAYRYTTDGGAHWHPMPPPELGQVHWDSIDPMREENHMLELLVSDGGLQTECVGGATPVARTERQDAPRVYIASPEAGLVVTASDLVSLAGVVRFRPGEEPAGFDMFWTSNREGYLASGSTALVKLSQPGRHVLHFHVVNADEVEMVVSRSIVVRPPEAPERPMRGRRSGLAERADKPCSCGGH